MEKRTRYQKIILVILAVMTLVFGVLTVRQTRQQGVQFRDCFLRQQVYDDRTVYSGRCEGENLAIFVFPKENETEVVCETDGGWQRRYTLELWFPEKADYWETYTSHSDAQGVILWDETGEELFRGFYDPTWDYLLNEDGSLEVGGYQIVYYNSGMRSFWDDHEPSSTMIVYMAMGPDLTHRGSLGLYALMVVCALFVALDVWYPKLSFELQHFLSVRNPEPSDFYIAMQRLGWAVYPVLIFAGYIYALRIIV